jgi:hypothetical protein
MQETTVMVRVRRLYALCFPHGCIKEYLKVPKCENFHLADFFYFYTIKPLWVGGFSAG